MLYTKPYLTIPQQIAQLEARGMDVPERDKAEEYLRRIGYYRLSAYWYPFRVWNKDEDGLLTITDAFRKGTSFKTITDLYAFDKSLRLIVLDAIERIEISIRTEVALANGRRGAFAHRNAATMDGRFTTPDAGGNSKFDEWLTRLDARAATSKDEFAEHFRTKYPQSSMPIWIAVELLDFGPLSHFLSGMAYRDLQVISAGYGNIKPYLIKSWIRSLCGVRNVCAHHSRLWNRPLIDQPRLPSIGELPLLDHLVAAGDGNKRIYVTLAIMRILLKIVNPRTNWHKRLTDLIATFPESEHISLSAAGFPEDWQELPLWKA